MCIERCKRDESTLTQFMPDQKLKFKSFALVFLILTFFLGNDFHAQNASFNTIPAAVNGVITICEGESIIFNSTSTGTNSNTDYDWNFQGGSPNSPNGSGPHSINYNNDGNYTASLTLENNSTASVNVQVINNNFNPSAPTLASPSTSVFGYSSSTFENLVYFKYCGTLIPYSSNNGIPFNFTLPSYPTGTIVSINWGDGTANTNLNNGSTAVSHTFNGSIQNEYTMSITYTLPGGCVITRTYGVFLGLAPTIQLSGNGNSACIPNDYEFNLLTNNIPNTTYVVIFNDNSPADTLIAPFNSLITHTFVNSSCGTNSVISGQGGTTITYPNSYASSIIATNACGNTFSSIGPIYVSEAVNADITVAPSNTVCLNSVVNLLNNSNPGGNVSNLGCDTTNNFYWNITQTSGYNIVGGSLGNGTNPFWPFWTSGSYNLNLQFTSPGSYDIELVVANGCGVDSITETINVIQFPVIPSNTITICNGNTFNYSPVNNPPTTIVPNGTTYTWTVVNNPNVGGDVNGSGSSISGTLTNSTNTTQNVVYTVTPSVNGCVGPPFTLTVQVVPGLVIPNYTANICNNGTFTVTPINTPPSVIIPSGTTFSWVPVNNPNVNGEVSGTGTSITGTLSTNITTPGQSVVYNVTANSGATCPSQTFQVTVFLNLINPPVIGQNQTVCSGGNPVILNPTTIATGTGTLSYQWLSSTNGTNWTTITNTNNPSYDPPPGIAVTTYYQVIATSTLNGVACAAPSNDLLITVNTLNPGVIGSAQTICSGGDPAVINTTTPASGAGSLSYQWQSSTTNTPAGFSNIPGATGTSYDPPSGLTVTTYYQLVVSGLLNGQTCAAITAPVTVNVNNITPGIIAANQTICSGGNPAIINQTTSAIGSGILTYTWQSSTTSPTTGFSDISGATGSTYDPPAGLAQTTYYQLITTSTSALVACSSSTNVVTVTINNVTASTISANQTICSGGNPDPFSVTTAATGSGTLNYQWQSSTTSASAGFSNIGGATSATYDPPPGLTSTTYYQVITTSVLNGVSCSAASNVVTVNVNNVSAGTIGNNQTVCSGGNPIAFVNLTLPSGAGALSYQWQSSTTGPSSGYSTIASATASTYDPPAGLTQTTYYQLIVTSILNGITCSATSAAVAVNVNNVSASVIASDQTVCLNGDPAGFTVTTAATGTNTPTYVWQSSTTSATSGFTNISGATSSTYNPPAGLTNTTYYQVIATSTLNGIACAATSNPVTVTVNNVTAGTITANQTICSGGDPLAFTNTVLPTGSGALSYQWQSSTTSSTTGFSNISGATTLAFDPPSGQTLTTYFQLVVTSNLNGISCTATTTPVTVTINNINSGVIGADQTICSGGNPAIINPTTAATGTGNLSYVWQSSTTSATSGFSPISGATQASYDPPAGLTQTTYYQLTTSSTLNGVACSNNTNVVTITINNVSAPNIGSNQTICSGGNPDPFATNTSASGSGNLTYQWQSSTTSPTAGFNNISGATGATYDPPNGLALTTYYQVITTSTLNGNSCQAISNVVSVTINNVAAGTVSGNQTVCVGGDPSAFTTVTAASGTGALTYQWQSSLTSSTTGFGDISGATSSTYNPPAGIQTTTYYQLVVTSTLNGITCTATTSPITVNVNQVAASVIADNQTVCSGGNPVAFTVTTPASGSSAPTYVWQSSTTSSTIGFTTISGAISPTYDPPSGITQTTYYQVIVTSTLNGVSCSATSNALTVTVIANPIANAGPDVNINCTNNNPGLTIGMGSVAGITYSWSPTAGLSASNISNPVASPTSTTTYTLTASDNVFGCVSTDQIIVNVNLTVPAVEAGNNFTKTCLSNINGAGIGMTSVSGVSYSWTPTTDLSSASISNPIANPSSTTTYTLTATNNASGCSATDQVTVTVNTNPPAANAGADFTKTCVQNPNGAPVGDVSVAGVTYSWSPTNGLSASNISNPTANPSVTTTYTVTATNTANGCTATDQVTVTVDNSFPTVNAGVDQVVCQGGNVTLTASGTDQYSWSNGITNGVSFIPTATTTYTVTGTDLVTGCVSTDDVIVTVNPIPNVNALTNQVICNTNNTSPIAFSGSVTGTVYSWTNSVTSVGLAATGQGNIAAFNASNATNAPISSTITVTPAYTNLGLTCTGTSQTMTITVNPTPQVNPINNQGICVGSNTASVNFASSFGVNPTTYNWTNTNSSIGIGVSGTGNVASFVGTNSTTAPINGSFQVTPTFTNQNVTCTGTPQSFLITINPTPTVVDPSDIVVCNNANVQQIVYTGSNASATYAWSNDNTSINLPATGSSSISTFPATNLSNTPITATITVTPSLTNAGITCTGLPENFTITVNPTPTVNPLTSQALCVGSSTSAVNFSSTLNVAGTNYSWTNTNAAIGLGSSGNGNITSFVTTNSGNTPLSGTITVTPSVTLNSVTCTGTTQSMNFVVNPIPNVVDPTDQVVCNGTLTQAVNFNGVVPGTVYNWTSSNTNINLLSSGSGSIPSFVATNTTNSPISSTITVTPSFTNAGSTCTGTPQTFTITVNPTPTVNPIGSQTLCVGSNTSTITLSSSFNVTGTTFNWTNSNAGIGLATSGNGDITSFTTLNTTTSPITGTISVTPTYVNQSVSCSGTPQSFTVVVNPIPNVVDPLDQVVCNGAQTNPVNFNGGVSGTAYNWTNTNTNINLSSNGTGNIPGFNALNSTNASISGTIIVTPTFTNAGTTCTGTPSDFTITVLPTPTVDAIANQVQCVGGATNAIVFTSGFGVGNTIYNWTNTNSNIGLATNGTGNIASFTTTNTGNSMISGTVSVTPAITQSGTSCQGTVQNFTISVNPIPTVSDPLDQVVCNGGLTTAVNFTGSVSGATYTWTASNTNIGIASGSTGNILGFTATNTTNAPIQSVITVTPSYQFGGTTCTGTSQSFTITVNPTPTVDIIANQALCVGTSTNPIQFSSAFGVSGTSFNWTNNNTSIGLVASGTGNIGAFNATNTTNSPITGTISVIPLINLNGIQCQGTPQTATITVNPIPVLTDPLDQVVCNGVATNTVSLNSTVNGSLLTWINDTPSTGLSANGTGNIPSFNGINTGTNPITATIVITPSYTNSNSTCTGLAQTMTITVNPTPTVVDPADLISCNGGTVPSTIFQGTGTSYTWTNNLTSIGLSASGTGNINSFTATNTGSNPLVSTVTVTPQYLNAGVNCSGSAQAFTITVNPSPAVTFSIPNQTICSQSLSNGVTISSATANADITWTIPTPPAGINGLTTTNGTNTVPPMTLTNTTSLPITIELFASATTPGSLACPGAGSLYTITVNPTPQLTDPIDQVICNGNPSTAVSFNGTGTSYTWTNSTSSIGLNASGSGTIPVFTAQNTSNAIVTSTVTVTPFYLNNTVNCPGPAQTFTFTINPTPTVNATSDVSVCNGGSSNLITFNGTGTSYNWNNGNTAIGLSATGSNTIPVFQGTNTSNNAINGTVTVTPIFENLGVSCPGPIDQFIITINPSPLVDDPTDQVICNNSSSVPLNFTGTGTSYSWTNSNIAIGLGGNGTGNINAFNGINSTSSPVSATITVTPQFTGSNLTCPGAPQTFTYTINPTPTVDNPTDQVICNGQTTQLVAFTGTGTSYSWVNNTPSIGLAATGNGNISPFIATNPNTAALTAVVTVTPAFTGSSVTCSGSTQDLLFTINPTPTVVDPADQVVCNGSLTLGVNFSGNGTSYTWTNSNPSIGLAASGTGNISAFNAVNTTSSPVTATITVVPNFTGGVASCNGVNQTFTITVNPTPTVNDLTDQDVCNGSPTAALNFTGTGTSYSWINSNPNIGLIATGTGDIASFTASNTGSNPIAGTLTVTAQYSNANLTCNGQQQTIIITVNPTPTVIVPSNLTLCNGQASNTIVLGGTGTSYNWTNSNPGIGLAANGTGNIPIFSATNSSNAPILSTITITPVYTLNGVTCFGSDQQFNIVVNPTPTVSDPVDQLVCNGGTTTSVNFIGTGTGYNWTNTIPSIGLSAIGSGNIAAFTAQNTTSTAVQAQIEVTPIYNNAGLVCSGTPQVFQIQVNPTPVVNDPLDVAYCNNSSVAAINFTGTATNYSWTNTNTSIGLAANGIGNISSFTGTNSTSNPIISTVTVTPFFTNTSLVCPGPTQSFTITINPTATVNDPVDQVVCNQLSTSAVNFTGSATSYSWTNSLPSIGLNGSGNGNIGIFNALNSGTTAQVATITVTPQFTGSGITCPGNDQTFTYTINPSPSVLPVAPISICNNDDFTVNLTSTVPSSFVWSATANNNVNGEVTVPQSSSTINNTLSNTTSNPQTVNYVVTPTSAPEGCVGPNTTFTVTVIPDVILNNNVPVEICSGGSVNAVLSANVPSTYSWFTTIDNPNVSGESITTNTGAIINDILINNSTTNQLVIYSVTPTSIAGNCVGPAQTIAVTVRPPLALLNEDTLTICSGNAVNLNLVANANVTFTWQAVQQYINVNGESISAVTSPIINDVLTNNTSTTQQVFYNVVGSSTVNGCSSPVFPILVNVVPTPSMNPVGNQTICNGDLSSPVNFTSSSTGLNYAWTNSNTSIGLAASGTGNIPSFSATNTGFTVVNANLTVTPTITVNNVTCPGLNQNFVITINPTPTVNSIANQTICNNTSASLVTLSGAVAGTTYSWSNSNTSIGLGNNGNGNIPAFLGQNGTFGPIQGTVTVTPSYTNNGVSCPGQSTTTIYTINPSPDVIPVSNQILCDNSNSNAVNFTSNVTNTQFTWTNSNNSIGLASSGIGNIPIFNAQNNGNLPIIATIAVTPTIQNGTLTCTGNTSNFTIQVNPTPTVDPILNMAFCNNTNGLIDFSSTFMNNNPAVTYTWQNTNTAVGIPASGNGDINFLATNPGNAPITAQITVTPNYLNNGVSCSGTPSVVFITVNPTPTVNPLANQTVCANALTQVDFTSTFVNNTNFSWTNSNTVIGLAASGTGDISFTSFNSTSTAQNASIIVTPTYANAGITCNGISQSFLITVNPIPVVGPVTNVTSCSNNNTPAVNFTSSVVGTSFSWTNTNTSIGIGASGVGNIPSFVGLNSGGVPNVGQFQVNSLYTNNGVTCQGNSQLFNITINPGPSMSPVNDVTFCANTVSSQITFTGSFSGITYSWSNSNTSIGLPANGTGSIPPFTAINTTNSIQTSIITVTPSYTFNGQQCNGTPQLFTISVNPAPVVNPINNVFYCGGQLTSPVVFTGGVSGTIYNWTNNNTATGLSASGVGNIPAFTTINNGTAPITSGIVVTPSITYNGLTCNGNTQSFNITVNPAPTFTVPTDKVICNGTITSPQILSSPVPNVTYTWTNNNTLIGLAASGNGNVPSFTATNNSASPISGLITITATYTNGGTSCTQTGTYTITINPTPNVVDPLDQVVCHATQTNAVNFQGNVFGTVFNWSNTNTTIGLASIGAGDISSFTGNNTSLLPISGTITVTPSYTNLGTICIGTPQNFTITVNPIPNVIDPLDQTICNNTNTAAINFSGSVPSTIYNWQNNTISIGMAANGSGNIASFTGTNNTTLPVTANVEVTPSFTNLGLSCFGTSQNFNITVNPSAVLINQNLAICSNNNLNINLSSSIPATFTWQAVNNPNVTGESFLTSQNSSSITDLLINTSNIPQIVIYQVTPTTNANGCISGPYQIAVTVNPLPDVQFTTLNNPLCNLQPVVFVNNTPGNNFYSWNFGDNSTSTDEDPTHTYQNFGSYNVSLQAIDANTGCTNTIVNTINIFESPEVGFELTSAVGCSFLNVVFTDTINAPNTTLFWDFGDGETSNQPVAIDHQYTDEGCYDVTLTVTNQAGCAVSLTQDDLVCVFAEPDAIFFANPDSALVSEPIIAFDNQSNNAYTYYWDFGDGSTSLSTNPIHEYDDIPESYVVTLYAYNEVGCYDSAFLTVTIYEEIIYYVPNTFTPNGDGSNDVFMPIITSGIETKGYELLIFNRWGEEIFRSSDPTIGWDGFVPDIGTYFGQVGNKAQDGTYVWKITMNASQNQDVIVRTGHVNLLR
jgi:gliding motility-associated-like protein